MTTRKRRNSAPASSPAVEAAADMNTINDMVKKEMDIRKDILDHLSGGGLHDEAPAPEEAPAGEEPAVEAEAEVEAGEETEEPAQEDTEEDLRTRPMTEARMEEIRASAVTPAAVERAGIEQIIQEAGVEKTRGREIAARLIYQARQRGGSV